VQSALASAYANAKTEAESEGLTSVSLDEILALSGIAPNLSGELKRGREERTGRTGGGFCCC